MSYLKVLHSHAECQLYLPYSTKLELAKESKWDSRNLNANMMRTESLNYSHNIFQGWECGRGEMPAIFSLQNKRAGRRGGACFWSGFDELTTCRVGKRSEKCRQPGKKVWNVMEHGAWRAILW